MNGTPSMTRDQIQTTIVDMLVSTFELDRDQIEPGSKLYEDLELDSIDALDMVVKLQELTGRRVGEEELRELRTVEDVVDLVVRVRDAAQAG